MKTPLYFVFFLLINKAVCQIPSDSLPFFALKFNPMHSLIDEHRHYSVSGEYFLKSNRSLMFTVGLANNKILKNANSYRAFLFRLEYRKFLKPFSNINQGRGYWGKEIMYKNAIEPYQFFDFNQANYPLINTAKSINVLAAHIKIGRVFVSKVGFPTVDFYFGLGGRTYYNFRNDSNFFKSQTMPIGEGFFWNTIGKYTTPSAVFGIGIGYGKWKRVKKM